MVWRIILITLHRSGVIFCLNLFFFESNINNPFGEFDL